MEDELETFERIPAVLGTMTGDVCVICNGLGSIGIKRNGGTRTSTCKNCSAGIILRG